MNPNEIAIVCCIEKGGLEYKGLCMILSLRKNWGKWKDVPIYAYCPREGKMVSDWLQEIYRKNNVVLVNEVLNKKYIDYPLANKPLSMAHAEKTLAKEFLFFLDSDIFCWNEPGLHSFPGTKDLAMVVDGTKTVASSGVDDFEYELMWRELYQLLGVQNEPYVKTLLTDEYVRGWWSSGVIGCRRSAGLMNQWLSFFLQAIDEISFVPQAHYLREQMTLCVIAAHAYEKFYELPVSYNYPVQNHYHYSSRGTSPEEAVLWHYQPYMNKAFRKFQTRLDKIKDVDRKIEYAENFIVSVKNNYPKHLGLDESLLTKYRKRLSIGPRLRKMIGKQKPTDP